MLSSCIGDGDGNTYNSLSFSDKIKLKQYKVQGKLLYMQHCANCHQSDGSGLARLIPSISNNTLIKSNREIAACIVKNGMEGELIINDIEYNAKMPANYNLTALEIAEIITYVGNSWNNSIGLVSSVEVEKGLLKCD